MADAESKPPAEAAAASTSAVKGEGGGKKRDETRRRRSGNYMLPTGVWRFSRSRMIKKKGLYRFMNREKKPAERTEKERKPRPPRFIKKPIGGEKNGKFRLIRIRKFPKYYPTERRPKRCAKKSSFFCNHRRRLRKSITPGTILILVAGRHRGKRVVFLKQLKSGLLLVTGPFKLNACPLRRINQVYVIATSTKLDISNVELPKLSDGYFRRYHTKKKKKDEGEIFEAKKEVYKVSNRKKEDQIKVDKQIFEVISKRPDSKMMFKYLTSLFSLKNKMYPHKMKF